MKKNMKKLMDRLEIDPGARELVRQMWKHGYKVKFSCEGHRNMFGIKNGAYIHYEEGTGDGWFEKNARQYGLRKTETVQFPPIYPEGKPYIIYRGKYIHHPEKRKYRGVLEKNLLLTVVISSIAISLVFLSSNLTGFAITNLTNKTSNMIGGALFVIGVICGYIWLRRI